MRHVLRTLGYSATAASVGIRAGSAIERRLTGGNAVTRRALMAHRATMATLFRAVRRHG